MHLGEDEQKILTTPSWPPSPTDTFINKCAEAYLGRGVISSFVFCWSSLLVSTIVGST